MQVVKAYESGLFSLGVGLRQSCLMSPWFHFVCGCVMAPRVSLGVLLQQGCVMSLAV